VSVEECGSRKSKCNGAADQHKVLHDLAAQYHRQTEAYDRLVCTGPMGRDGILPADGYEQGMINRNAHEIRKVIEAEAAKHGYTPAQLHRAIVATAAAGQRSSPSAVSAVCPDCGGIIGKRADGQYWCKDGWPEGSPLEWGCGWSSTVLPNAGGQL